MVTGDRWSLGTGGHWRQVVTGDRWSLGTGGHWRQVVTGDRWSLGTGGHYMFHSKYHCELEYIQINQPHIPPHT